MNKKLKTNDEYEVNVSRQDHFGKGISNIDDFLIFIDNALSGDICKIRIKNIKKNYANATLEEIISPSKDRVVPICPYYHTCGGCHIMHQEYSKQLKFKEQKVRELLEKFAGIKNPNVFSIIYKDSLYYRNKIILHGNKKELGFYQEKSNDVVKIEECLITNQKINEVYKKVQQFLMENSEFFIKKIMFRITSLNEIMIVLEGNCDIKKLLSYFDNVHTIYLNKSLIKGNPYILEDIFGIKFQIYPYSFFQVNYQMMLAMYQLVIDFYKNKNYKKVLDLYCGTGTIGMLVSPYVKEVVGIEVEPSAIQSANLCKELNKITNISFIEGKVEDNIDQFQDIDSIIVDPPRSGLDSYTISNILKILPKTIIYISCDPVTLCRDLKILLNQYELTEIHPIDMFPNTYHVETFCVLERK